MRNVSGRPDSGHADGPVIRRHAGPITALAAILLGATAVAQQISAPEASGQGTPQSAPAGPSAQGPGPSPRASAPTKQVKARDKQRAAKLYLAGSKLFNESKFELAMQDYEQAAALDPTNSDYSRAAAIARSHAVTALIQSAAKARTQGKTAQARAALQRALELDPANEQVAGHLNDLADNALLGNTRPLYEQGAERIGEAPVLEPAPGVHTFHLKTDRRQLIQQVYKAYGIDAAVDQSVSGAPTRFDLDDATFAQAVETLDLVTKTFEVPLDPHRVVSATDTTLNRQQYVRQSMETIYLPGTTSAEMTELSNIAKNVFATQQVAVEQSEGTMTVRGPMRTLDAFNATMQDLLNGRPQVMLDVDMIQLAHMNERNTGVQLPQQITAFNVYTEEQAILNANQALVQQIIASGLAAPGDTLAILGILIASGAVPNSIFQNGFALFGGGLTLSGITTGPATLHFALNSSESRELDHIQLRMADGQDQTIKSGTRYPIQVAAYSGVFSNNINIPGLTTAGTSSSLSALASTLSAQQPQIPQVQYQDLGLTLKANPRVMRSGDVALTLDMKITALTGSFVNGNPVLNNRSYSGVVTLREGVGAILVSELDSQESRALSGTPGLTEIPGFDNITNKDVQKNYATLLIMLTPHLVRGTQPPGHSPIIRVQRGNQAQ
jgi:tetratricopeptide (TPR) repeat protein